MHHNRCFGQVNELNDLNHPCENQLITQTMAMGSTHVRFLALNVIKTVEQFVLLILISAWFGIVFTRRRPPPPAVEPQFCGYRMVCKYHVRFTGVACRMWAHYV